MSAERLLEVAALLAANLLYLLPVLLVAERNAPDLRRVVLVDVLLGWTVAGWLYCLWLALRQPALAARARQADWRDPSLQDLAPAWSNELPGRDRPWQALSRDSTPLLLPPDAEQP